MTQGPPQGAAIAALVVITLCVWSSGVVSMLLYLPALAVAETIPRRFAGARGWVWFGAALLPLLIGAVAGITGMARVVEHPLFSPHVGAPRSHLCLEPFFQGRDGAFRAALICGAAVAPAVSALVRAVAGGLSSMRLARAVSTSGLDVEQDWGQEAMPLRLVPTDRLSIACVGLLRPVIAIGRCAAHGLSPPLLRAALAHEVAHARGRHNLLDLITATTATLLAFAPTAHLYRRYWRREAELAADAFAAARTSPEDVAVAMRAVAAEGRDAAAVDERTEALRDHPGSGHAGRDSERGGRGEIIALATLFGAMAAGAFGFALGATRAQIADSLHCWAESLLRALMALV